MNPTAAVCHRCAGPMSPITRRCTRCGAARPRYAFGMARADRAPEMLRIAQVVALAACVGLPLLAPAAPGRETTDAAFRFGAALGTALAALLLASLPLAWWRATRRFIPFATLVVVAGITFLRIVFLGVMGYERARRAEMDEQVAGLRGVTAALTDTSGAALPVDPAGPPPAASRAKSVWVLRRFMGEFVRHVRQDEARYGVEDPDAPAVFNTSRYMASAGAHPEVGRYWDGVRGSSAELRRTLPAWTDSTLRALGREAGMTRFQIDRMMEDRARSAGDGPNRWTLQEELAAAALAYHRYLVSVDGRVRYDAGRDMALFDREDELARANLLEERMRAAAHELDAYADRHRDALASLPDSFAAGGR
jgi:hypothetical protein